jgi:hypothetical protein
MEMEIHINRTYFSSSSTVDAKQAQRYDAVLHVASKVKSGRNQTCCISPYQHTNGFSNNTKLGETVTVRGVLLVPSYDLLNHHGTPN